MMMVSLLNGCCYCCCRYLWGAEGPMAYHEDERERERRVTALS